MKELIENINNINSTELGKIRIKNNLELAAEDVVNWCKNEILNADRIIKKGKNWYVYVGNITITINANSYTIITAHKIKGSNNSDKNILELPKTKEELYNKYFLKNDLISICKKYNLPTTGSKGNLLEYICCFIENKPVKKAGNAKIKTINNFRPSINKKIDENYSNNEIHRAFFIKTIGNHFKFNVTFMNWMAKNKAKKTYKDAITEYNKIVQDKKNGKKLKIGAQFEYNQYTRNFFEENPNLTREDCIKCWNFKKKQIGNHKYETKDLKILK